MLPATSELGEIEEEGHRRNATGQPQIETGDPTPHNHRESGDVGYE